MNNKRILNESTCIRFVYHLFIKRILDKYNESISSKLDLICLISESNQISPFIKRINFFEPKPI